MSVPTTQPDPEFCPKSQDPDGRNIHTEAWYDCEPCAWCGDDTPPTAYGQTCDCGRPGHAAIPPTPTSMMSGGPVTVFETISDWMDNVDKNETMAACIERNASKFNMVPVSIRGRHDDAGLFASTYAITFRACVREDLVRFLMSPDGGGETPGSIDKDNMIVEVAL